MRNMMIPGTIDERYGWDGGNGDNTLTRGGSK